MHMKKLLLMAFLAVGMTANAETMTFSAANDDDKGGIDLGKGKDEDDRWSMHFNVGVDVPTGAPEGMKFAPFRSWEIGWTILQYDYTPGNSKTTLSAGIGFDWRSYTLKGHEQMFVKRNDVVVLGPLAYIETAAINTLSEKVYLVGGRLDDLSSNIHTVSLSMPLLVRQQFSKNFGISLGAQLNWNYYARIHSSFNNGDDECSLNTKDIGQRPITIDALGMVHFGDLSIYCKYSPMSVLKTDRGPEFKSLAFGIYF